MISTFEYGGKEHKLQTACVIPRVLSKLFRLEEGRIVLIKGREIFKQEDGRFQPLADGRYTLTIGDSVNTDHADPYIINESEEEQKQEAAVQNHENSCRDSVTFERSVTTTPVVDVDENEAQFRELKTKHPFLHALATTSVKLKLLCCVAKSAPDISLKSCGMQKENFGSLHNYDSVHGALYEIASSISSFYHQANQAMQTVHIELSSMPTSLQSVVRDLINIESAATVTLSAYKTNTTAHIESCLTALEQMKSPLKKINTLASDLFNVLDKALTVSTTRKDELLEQNQNLTSELATLNLVIKQRKTELQQVTETFLLRRQNYEENLKKKKKNSYKYKGQMVEDSKNQYIEVNEDLACQQKKQSSLEEKRLENENKLNATLLCHNELENFKKLAFALKESLSTIPKEGKLTATLKECQSQLPPLFKALDCIINTKRGYTEPSSIVPSGVKFIAANFEIVHNASLYTVLFEKIIKPHFESALRTLTALTLPSPPVTMESYADAVGKEKVDINYDIMDFVNRYNENSNLLQKHEQGLYSLFYQ